MSMLKVGGRHTKKDKTQKKTLRSKLQVLSFMFVPNCRRCPLPLNLTSFVLNVSKSCSLCPLG
ncbi:hypothetical protein Hanom_Chr12g01068441 [Helianthus anomalus]